MIEIRGETAEDRTAVHDVNCAAFERADEADLVDALRERAASYLGLVAVRRNRIVGHIAFTPARIEGAPSVDARGLAPMAVHPDIQRSGVGSRLVQDGLAACAADGADVIVVLGHPEYYPRFGFERADRYGLYSEYDAPDAFFVLALATGALDEARGLVRYDPVFGG